VSSHASRWFLSLLLCSLACGLGCGVNGDRDAGDGETAPPSAGSTSAPPSEAELIEQLSAIGYLAGTEQARDSQGVTQHDPQRVAPGLNLITSGHGPVALLMDMDGEVLYEWRAEFERVFPGHPRSERAKEHRRNFWRDALLFPNGDILVIWELFGLFKLDRDSRVLWAVPEPAHHDLALTESGEIVHLQAERMMIPGIAEKLAVEDFIVVRDGGGGELRRIAMSDALRNVDWRRLRKAFWARSKERGYGLNEKSVYDPFHTNSLWLLSAVEAARLGDSFRAGDALVSMAMLDTIAILDMEKGVHGPESRAAVLQTIGARPGAAEREHVGGRDGSRTGTGVDGRRGSRLGVPQPLSGERAGGQGRTSLYAGAGGRGAGWLAGREGVERPAGSPLQFADGSPRSARTRA
jgi:hypothetical protein